MSKKYSIHIPKPCTEDWGQMTQTEKGKHCAACNKVVIDFSKMNNEEIISILLKNKGKKVCGNFYQTQIENPIHYISLKTQTKWPAIAAMLIAGMFQLSTHTLYAQKDKTPPYYSTTARTEAKKTEPVKDSLITYTIQVFSKESKLKIVGATISIDSVGTFTTDTNGEILLSLDVKKIPRMIHIQVSAYSHELQNTSFQTSKLAKTRHLEFWLKERQDYMMRGDVNIEETH